MLIAHSLSFVWRFVIGLRRFNHRNNDPKGSPRTVRKLTVTQSSGLPVVVSEHAAQAVSTVNLTATWKRCKLRPDNLVFERLMIAFGVIMNHELFNGPAQRSFAKRQYGVARTAQHRSASALALARLGNTLGTAATWLESGYEPS